MSVWSASGRRKRGWALFAAGTAIIIATFAASILAPGEEAHGLKVALFAAAFWVVFTAGAVGCVWGVVVLLGGLSRTRAVQLAAATFGGIVLAVLLHNLWYAAFGSEEPFFFLFALWLGPVLLVAAIVRAIFPGPGPRGGTSGVGGSPLLGA